MGFASAITGGLAKAATMMSNVMLDTTGTNNGSSGFDIITFLDNAAGYLKQVGHYIMVLAGVILVIVAIVQIAKGFASGGRGQVNWVMSIACLLVGGMLIFGGWNLATALASVGKNTVETLGGGSLGGIDASESGAAGAGQDGFTPAGQN